MQQHQPPVQGISAGNASQITPFSFGDSPVRVITIGGEPWFVAADVCAILGQPNVAQVVSRLDDDEKGIHTVDTLGGAQQASAVSESGLYSLVLTSRKPEAKRFKKWVTAEVLPSIRKTGQYGSAPSATPALPSVRDLALMVIAAEDAKEKAEVERDAAQGALALAAPKAAALDLISAGHDTVTITEAAKVLGIKRAVLVAKMHADGWIYRQNQSWVAYDQHIKNGRLQYTDEKTGMECVKPYCHITQKGLAKLAQAFAVEVAA